MSNESKLRYAPEARDNGYSSRFEVVLDAASGKLRVSETNSNDNAVTFYRFHGHELVFDLDSHVMGGIPDADALDELLKSDEVTALVKRITEGYESVWNGSNHVAQFAADATGEESHEYGGAAGELQALLYTCNVLPEGAGYWSASEWLSSVNGEQYGVTASSTGAELETIRDTITAEALGELVKLDENAVLNWLENQRERLQDAAEAA